MDLVSLFRNESDVIDIAPGSCIFEQGSAGDRMYVVVEGAVELSVDGRVVDVLGPGELFGEMALIDEAPRSATATAREGCRLATMNERRFTFLVQQTPYFALHVMRVLARRLRAMDANLAG